MNEFGVTLRAFRSRCIDPLTMKPLTQERLGGLLLDELGVRFSGAAVSDWERGESKIHADDRLLLVSLIKLLHRHGGMRSLAEANELLEAGNYRALNADEIQLVFPGSEGYAAPSAPALAGEGARAGFGEKWAELLDEAREGPSPAWPRVVVAWMRVFLDRISAFGFLRALAYVWIYLFTRAMIAPSLRWPFENQSSLSRAAILYCAGTLILPALIGLLAETKNNEFWRKTQVSDSALLRLYTHQGAFIGFHLGYFAAFIAVLVGNFVRLPSFAWFDWIILLAPLVMGYFGSRVVPYNLWRAFGRLSLRDGGVFFIFVPLGPFWGFFLARYSSLLASPSGLFIVLLAVTLLTGGMAWQARKKQNVFLDDTESLP